jgi:hypothetical protein
MKTKEEYKLIFDKQLEQLKIEREKNRKKFWDNLKHFENPDDVPEIPRVGEKEYKEFYIPRLIDAGAIPKKDLIDGQVYVGNHRNCTLAKWNKEKNKFDHWRYKFGWVKDDCNHFEDNDGFALFVPIGLGTEEEFNNQIK